jgi:LPS-assembly lipoprotein
LSTQPNPIPHPPTPRKGEEAASRSRRARLIAALALSGALLSTLTACGFRLRGARDLPFDTIYLGFAPNSQLGAELARNIRAGTRTAVIEEREKAQAVLDVLSETREREVLSLDATGKVREFTLRLRFAFRLHDGKGREYLAPTTLAVHRDIAYNESQILAQEAQESLLYRDMQSDLVQQLLRRIAAVHTAPKPPAPTTSDATQS